MYDISVSTMCIYCDYCVYHYKSTELVSLYTLDIGLKINIIIIIIITVSVMMFLLKSNITIIPQRFKRYTINWARWCHFFVCENSDHVFIKL